MSSDERSTCRKQWLSTYLNAIEEDSWGHPVEASEAYEKLIRSIDQKQSTPGFQMNVDERSLLTKTRYCLKQRVAVLSDQSDKQSITLEQMKQLKAVFENIFVNAILFPINIGPVIFDDDTDAKESALVVFPFPSSPFCFNSGNRVQQSRLQLRKSSARSLAALSNRSVRHQIVFFSLLYIDH